MSLLHDTKYLRLVLNVIGITVLSEVPIKNKQKNYLAHIKKTYGITEHYEITVDDHISRDVQMTVI